jgi:hypothetical protein
VPPSYPDFRKRLDAVLSRRDPAALRAFLIGEGQWDADTTTDPERAMWMMIATSPALVAMRAEALSWLTRHGYTEETQALGGRDGGGQGARRPNAPEGQRRGPPKPTQRRQNRSSRKQPDHR